MSKPVRTQTNRADPSNQAPRLAMLFYLVCFTALLLPASSRTSGQAPGL